MSDLEMPLSIIQRLVKEGQSEDDAVTISKDAKKAFQQLSGLFALYLFSK